MKFFLLLSLLISSASFAMPVGFNQAWFHNDYGNQYLDGTYDETEVERIFKLTHEAGSTNLRLWFFESSAFPMLSWNGHQITGIRKDFIDNVIKTLEIAKKYDVKVYMTFMDAHAYRPDKLNRAEFKRLRQIYQSTGSEEFLTKAIAPLLKSIHEAGLASSISRIDLSNEMDTVINRFGFDQGWKGASRMLCQWRSFIRSLDGFHSTPVTFSLRLHPLIFHPLNLLSDEGPMKCADYLDFHSYGDSGKIYRCQTMKKYSQLNKKKLILGEFGQSYFNHRYDNNLQADNTVQYLKSAQACGFSEALSWRLSDIRPGHNKEARYSFEAFGQMRPAYHVIKEHNLNLR